MLRTIFTLDFHLDWIIFFQTAFKLQEFTIIPIYCIVINVKEDKREMKKKIPDIEKAFKNWWWVILFAISSLLLFEHGLKKRNQEFNKLYKQWHEWKKLEEEALVKQENLLLQINSQSDPAWVELILIKRLGVVPEGKTKVFFKKSQHVSTEGQ